VTTPYIQHGKPGYCFAYTELEDGKRVLIEMINLNMFVRVLVPLPRIKYAQVNIFLCIDDWSYGNNPEFSRNYEIFSDDTIVRALEEYRMRPL